MGHKRTFRSRGQKGLESATITPHVMRHTAITKLAKARVDLVTVQKISGHKTVKAVVRYVPVHDEYVGCAIAAIGMGIPECSENRLPDTMTPKSHATAGKRAGGPIGGPSNDRVFKG